MRQTLLAVLVAIAFLPIGMPTGGAASGVTGALPALPDLLSFALVRNEGTLRPVSAEEAADVLKDYDVIFLGELHDHTANHLAQMALFRALYARVPDLTLSMEQFERDVQPVVDDYMAGRIGEETLRSKGRAWSNYAESYRPLVEYAKERRLPLIAANAPASIVRCIGEEGPDYLARLSRDKRAFAAAELHLEPGSYRDKFVSFLREDLLHGDERDGAKTGGPTESELRSYASQVARDDTMAESLFLAWQKHPERKIVHLTGAFHVEGGLGTAERLKLRAPHLKIAIVVPGEASDPDHPSLDAARFKGDDFVVLLRAEPKEYATKDEEKAAVEQMRAMIRSRSGQARCEA